MNDKARGKMMHAEMMGKKKGQTKSTTKNPAGKAMPAKAKATFTSKAKKLGY